MRRIIALLFLSGNFALHLSGNDATSAGKTEEKIGKINVSQILLFDVYLFNILYSDQIDGKYMSCFKMH